jgi:hypothetical protein
VQQQEHQKQREQKHVLPSRRRPLLARLDARDLASVLLALGRLQYDLSK